MGSPLQNFSLLKADGSLKSAEDLQQETAARVQDARARAQRLGAEIAANVVEARSRNGVATVTVQAAGTLRSVRLSDRAKGMGPAMIAASVMEAYHLATEQAAARTREIATAALGDERTARLMAELVPDTPPDTEPSNEER
ncbi:Conserved DNA-binding protein YbaB [Jatrophihabitans endophyticus]|uniref:Conserved DNA-binding protein YbaB n=1 Tax=Jatrophihabitans endophyticus TaxID=1206085 RepID=A0A1M5L146_9ACTN|nr:YbaB/EbfC family nucleoid-associated protein [Jatrophihabitans endophyticus]SHG58737.1 Conserved DNA-binding protein YbaB [Jatrophihabitans endophyticus]